MKQLGYSEALKAAQDYEKNLLAADFNFNVQVIFEEGSEVFYHNALARDMGNYIAIYPEHHPMTVVGKDDAKVYMFEKRMEIPFMETLIEEEETTTEAQLDVQVGKLPPGQIDVHTEHCCKNCGCKYGDSDCSVRTGRSSQSFPCGKANTCGGW